MTLDRIYGASITANNFRDGLANWRSALLNLSSPKLSSDSDFSINANRDGDYGILQLTKTKSLYEIVQHKTTPIKIGQYLEIRFRIRVSSGAEPKARVICAPVKPDGTINLSAPMHGPMVNLISGRDNFVTAIIGSGARPGVDLAWGLDFTKAYCGIEISGANGGELLINDMEVSDVTGHFLSTNSDWVDIRDFGAFGDGRLDCRDAFVAADAEANGRAIFIPEGRYFVGSDLTLLSPIRAYGRIECADATAVMLADRYNLNIYIDVFKDVTTAFKKAIQALYRYKNHNSLDLCGRCIDLREPLDVHKIVGTVDSFTTPRVVHNGQIEAKSSTAWEDKVVNSSASWSSENADVLTNVANASQIEIGSLVQGSGVGREVFVRSINKSTKTVYLSANLSHPSSSQSYRFTRFQFMFDFSGFQKLTRFELRNIDFQCNSLCSVWMFAREGIGCRFCHNWVHLPKDRVLCSYAEGCNGLTVESNFFKSSEQKIAAKNRKTIAISTRMNDMKVRNNHAAYFRHFAFLYGANHLVLGNHFFQGSWADDSARTAGIVFTYNRSNSVVSGNYIDNCWIETTGELGKKRTGTSNAELGQLAITNNTFLASTDDASFRFIKLCPNGKNVPLYGITVTGNMFACHSNPEIKRVEGIDTSSGSIRTNEAYLIRFENNAFNGIQSQSYSPIIRKVTGSSNSWRQSFSDVLPFDLQANNVESVVCQSDLSRFETPKVLTRTGSNGQSVDLKFSSSTSGSVIIKASADLPM